MKEKICIIMSLLLLLCSISVTEEFYVVPANAETINNYGLQDNIQDGVILHCFDWTYNDIKAELPNIAKAGFTSIQTSPAQTGVNSGIWYWLYQPLGFSVSSNDLGTRSELQQLCTEAERYGIKVIVDVVANHLAGNHTNIQSDLKDSKYWHTYGQINNYSDRYAVTYGDLGMQDIASENEYVQQLVRNYILDLKSLGVDGIRWDAAKHIGLSSEGCGFWSTVCQNSGLYHYGEILGEPGASTASKNNELMGEYTSYMSVTDSSYGQSLRNAFNEGKAPTSYGNWTTKGIHPNKLVYWGESHDTWSNDKESGYSNEMTQNVIDRAYAMAASRQSATALYLSRPSSAVKTQIMAGAKGSTHFKSAEVSAINHFHNAMVGQSEYFVSSNNVAAVCREKGVVIAMGSGSGAVSIPNGGSLVEPGTYKDEITGNTFTVTSSTISGTVGSTGIAVVYDYENSITSTTHTAYIDLPSGWSTPVSCYVYDQIEGTTNAGWPGVAMTYDSKTGYYKYEIPDNITTPRVIFYSSSTNRYPGDQQEGLSMDGGANWLYQNGVWKQFNPNEVTTEKPTETTTSAPLERPVVPTGVLVTSNAPGSITFVMGNPLNGQTYNVYLDGVFRENVVLAQYTYTGITPGHHTLSLSGVLNGFESDKVTFDVDVQGEETTTVAPTTAEPTTKEITTKEETTTPEPTTEETPEIKIAGFQINPSVEGFRTVFTITGSQTNVQSIGLIYGLKDHAATSDMVLNSSNKTVFSYSDSSTGISGSYTDSLLETSTSVGTNRYMMTMKYGSLNKNFFNAPIYIRGYLEKKDGTILYGDIQEITVYQIANYLYQNKKMNSLSSHQYLYERILSRLNPQYQIINY
ncbi:MAG: starch-binding protein [Eubacterium sp.]|nr:starch-binding protein [Eubacterium sp.]